MSYIEPSPTTTVWTNGSTTWLLDVAQGRTLRGPRHWGRAWSDAQRGLPVAPAAADVLTAAGLAEPVNRDALGYTTLAGPVVFDVPKPALARLRQYLRLEEIPRRPVIHVHWCDTPDRAIPATYVQDTDLGAVTEYGDRVAVRTSKHTVVSTIADPWTVTVHGPTTDLSYLPALFKLIRDAVATTFEARGYGVAVHATTVDVDGSAVVLAADSGIGKTALALASGHPIVADESTLITVEPAPRAGRAITTVRTEFFGPTAATPASQPLSRVVLVDRVSRGAPVLVDIDAVAAWARLVELRRSHRRLVPPAAAALTDEARISGHFGSLAASGRIAHGYAVHGDIPGSARQLIAEATKGGDT